MSSLTELVKLVTQIVSFIRFSHAYYLRVQVQVDPTMGSLQLLDMVKDIENKMGREKTIDKGPRNIDLDILLHGNREFAHERLSIPHKSMLEREFVLRPLCE